MSQRHKVELLLDKLDGLGDLSERSLLAAIPGSSAQASTSKQDVIRRTHPQLAADQAHSSLGSPASIVGESPVHDVRQRSPGPRRLPVSNIASSDEADEEAGDLGGQLLQALPGRVPVPQHGPLPNAKPVRRLVSIRRRTPVVRDESPAFRDALTSLLSPVPPSPTRTPPAPDAHDLHSVGMVGLGISQPAITGLGISDMLSVLPETHIPVHHGTAGLAQEYQHTAL
jgi:hypothetical protein